MKLKQELPIAIERNNADKQRFHLTKPGIDEVTILDWKDKKLKSGSIMETKGTILRFDQQYCIPLLIEIDRG